MLFEKTIRGTRLNDWSGLVDGLFAISLTLMALEMPGFLEQMIEIHRKGVAAEESARLLFLTADHFAGYLFVFLVLLDLWSVHRAILMFDAKPLRRHAVWLAASLSLAMLVPVAASMSYTVRISLMAEDGLMHVVPPWITNVILLFVLLSYLTAWALSRSVEGKKLEAVSEFPDAVSGNIFVRVGVLVVLMIATRLIGGEIDLFMTPLFFFGVLLTATMKNKSA